MGSLVSFISPRVAALSLVAVGMSLFAMPAASAPPRAPARTASRAKPVPASRAWHTKDPGDAAPLDAAGRPQLVLRSLNLRERVALVATTATGAFDAESVDRAARVLREPSSGNEHPVDPHLLDLVYRLQVRFDAPEIRVVSGYRTPRGKNRSNHGKGRAIDLVVPGATDEEVAAFVREQGFCGVGVYPVSGFVHVDVRDRSFFWVDASGPGKRGRVRGILADLARRSDLEAAKRGEHPTRPFLVGNDVEALGAWAQRPAPPEPAEAEPDLEADHDDEP